MKSLATFVRSLFSLGLVGFVLLVIAGIVCLTAFTSIQKFNQFHLAWNSIDALAALEDQVGFHLREMERFELNYAFTIEYETPSSNELQQAAYHAGQINQILDQLVAEGYFEENPDYDQLVAELDDFRSLLNQHLQDFGQQVVQLYQAGDLEAARDNLDLLTQEQNADLQYLLKNLVTSIEADRASAERSLPQVIATAFQGIGLAIITMLLLALLGYSAINHLTQPLLKLTSAIIAIGGDKYHPELLGKTLGQRGQIGHFARSLDAFAKAIEKRDAHFKQEIIELREQLYTSRRRRLKISRPSETTGEPS